MLKLNGMFAAIASVLFFLQISAFSSIADVNNYNFISPYSHEITHGILLLLFSVYRLICFSKQKNLKNAFICGIAVGLSLLTKPEIALANIVGVGCGWWAILRYHSDPKGKWRLSSRALLGVILPSIFAIVLFSLAMPVGMVFESITTPLRLMVSSKVRNIPLYKSIVGIESFTENIIAVSLSLALNGFIIALLLFTEKLFKTKDKIFNAKFITWVLVGIGIIYLLIPVKQRHSISLLFPSCWPLASLLLILFLFLRKDKNERSYPIILTMALYSFLLLSKTFFRAIFAHYGVFLLIPGSLLFISYIFTIITKSSVPSIYKTIHKVCIVALLFIIVFPFVEKTYYNLLARNIFEETKRGNIYINQREQGMVFDAIHYLRANIGKDDTLAVLPQGAGVNYILGKVNPTRYITILPLESIAFGKQNILDAYAQHPPDWVVVFSETTGDTTSADWMDFARRLDAYARNYAKPLEGRFFSVFKRKSPS